MNAPATLRTRGDAIDLELAIDVGLLDLVVGRTINRRRLLGHDVQGKWNAGVSQRRAERSGAEEGGRGRKTKSGRILIPRVYIYDRDGYNGIVQL